MKIKESNYFVPVLKEGATYYGGHQEWLKELGLSKFFRDRACVVTAFTNVYFYMFERGLVDFKTYNDMQYKFYRRLRPKANGVPTASSLLRRIRILNHQMNLGLSYRILEENLLKKVSLEKKIAFIEEALAKDSPVILINWLSRDIDIMSHHGLVITEMNKKNDKHELVVSSWDRRYSFYLEDFDKSLRTYTGLIYFERNIYE